MKANRCARRRPLSRCPLGIVGAALLTLAGCGDSHVLRSQADDDIEQAPYSVETINQWVQFDGAEPMPVYGVSLVTGLANTGGEAPPSDERTLLERELQKEGVLHVKDVLKRKDVAMVRVAALVPPGARKGDPIDLEVTLPDGSKATSLEGGYLEHCLLSNFAAINQIAPNYKPGNNNWAKGHPWVEAEGKLQVGLGAGDESARVRQGRLWGGGTCKASRPLYLYMNEKRQQAQNTLLVAERINEAFRASLGGALGDRVAAPKSGTMVELNVPPQYRLNLLHYMRVVGLIRVQNNETSASKSADAGRTYHKRLEDEVLDPAHTVTAALRLEALGDAGKAALKRGLHDDSLLVRFCCAEALAYEGEPLAALELAKMVDEPALRAFCLTALASLDESASYQALTELLSSPVPETRYGAFLALRALNKDDDAVRGELLGESFWLHRTAPGSRGMIHVSSSRRAEIVLFGDDASLKPPLCLSAGEVNVTAGDGDSQCTVSLFSPRTRKKVSGYSSLKVEDVIRKVAELGGDYATVTDLLRQARRCECVSCTVEVDALPQAASVYALKRAGQRAKARADGQAGADDDEEVLSSRLDLGATPVLFDRDGGARRLRSSEASIRDRRPDQER